MYPAEARRPLVPEPTKPDVTLRITNLSHEVAPNHIYQTKAYNGAVPGPLIRLKEGVPIDVHIINQTDSPEYVHWHGLSVPPEIDGTEEEGSLVVPEHGELRYSLTPRNVGTRYVHSHAMSGMRLDSGTYSGQFGFVYVEPKRQKGRYDQEVFLATHEWGPELRWQPDEDDDDLPSRRFRFEPRGNWEVQYDIGSINGKALGHGEPVRVKSGQRVLVHLLNASATATVQLAFSGHQFLVTAMDGNAVPSPQWVDRIELGPAERVDAIVEMNNPGIWILGSADDDEREIGKMGVVVEYAGKTGPPQWIVPSSKSWDYATFSAPASESIPAVVLPMTINRLKPTGFGMEGWTINGKGYDPGAPTVLQSGTSSRLVLQNRSDDDHPLHLHRYSFELKSVNGKRAAGIVKDVVVVRAHGSLEVEFTPDRPGLCLFHCHQQMHMDNGFKVLLKVV
jgi:FtsP/CotA-like multicopper oxidase with cupredoxin domain